MGSERTDPHELAPGTVLSDWRIEKTIGCGSSAHVYEVLHIPTNTHRALKKLRPDRASSEEDRARFAREASILGPIYSPHKADVFHYDPAASFLVMELLRGEDLDEWCRDKGPLSAELVVELLSQAASLLDEAHAHGIVHRDLKLTNLFLVTDPRGGTPLLKVLDFGIAKVDGETLATNSYLGTLEFMAPEQAGAGPPVGPPADIYALGQVAYRLLVGKRYWTDELHADQSERKRDFFDAVRRGAVEGACARAARTAKFVLPPAFDAWFATATAVDPTRRFASVTELIRELAIALGVSPAHRHERPAASPTSRGSSATGSATTPTPGPTTVTPPPRAVASSPGPAAEVRMTANRARTAGGADREEPTVGRRHDQIPLDRSPALVGLTILVLLGSAAAAGWWWNRDVPRPTDPTNAQRPLVVEKPVVVPPVIAPSAVAPPPPATAQSVARQSVARRPVPQPPVEPHPAPTETMPVRMEKATGQADAALVERVKRSASDCLQDARGALGVRSLRFDVVLVVDTPGRVLRVDRARKDVSAVALNCVRTAAIGENTASFKGGHRIPVPFFVTGE